MTKHLKLPDKFINIIYETNRNKFEKIMDCNTEGCNGMCGIDRDTRTVIVGVFNGSIEVLHHELYHAMDYINQLILEDSNSHFSESNAYLSTYIFKTFRRGLK